MTELYHFTSEAQAREIDAGGGWLRPAHELLPSFPWPAHFIEGTRYVWLTDEPSPVPRLLGFSDGSEYLAVRYRVVDPSSAIWWPRVRHRHSRAYLDQLEAVALVGLWYVVEGPVLAERDPSWHGRPGREVAPGTTKPAAQG